MEELDKILRRIRESKPGMESRYELRESIMEKVNKRANYLDYFFGWTDVGWLRKSLAFASVIIVLFFCGQQVFMTNRIDKLEKRMISINTDNILQYQRENVMANSVLYRDADRKKLADSIKVATDDLLDLVKSYRDLQLKYENVQNEAKQEKQENRKQKL